jgi:hypothetical protein
MDNSRLIETNCDTACASETEQGGRKRRAKGEGSEGREGIRQATGKKTPADEQANNEQRTTRPSQPPPAQRQREAEQQSPTQRVQKKYKKFQWIKKNKYLSSRKNVNF